MLGIGLSEVLSTKYVNGASPDLDSWMDSDASPITLSDAHSDYISLNLRSSNGLEPRHLVSSSHDVRGVARINPQSEVFE